jgi:hypothetical protein
LLGVGRRAEAIAQFTEAQRLDPNHAGARAGLDSIRRGGAGAP